MTADQSTVAAWFTTATADRKADSTGRRNAVRMEACDGYQEAALGAVHPVAISVSGTTTGCQSGSA